MINFSDVRLKRLVVHNVGCKNSDNSLQISISEIKIDDQIVKELLMKYFLSSFKSEEYYNFYHDSDINLNEMFVYSTQIFENPDDLYLVSLNIAKHLHNNSVHPKIKSGEFYIVHFEDCMVDDEIVECLGLFKSENKDTYLKVYHHDDNFEINYDNGINIKKLDKGCLIFKTEKDAGYKISIIDTVNKDVEALYWREDFLKIKPRDDNFYSTKSIIDLCKTFSEQVLSEGDLADKKDKINFIKKTEKYLCEAENFDMKDFEKNVIDQPEIKAEFKNFKAEYQEMYDLKPDNNFKISANAIKKSKKYFRSVIKLDKNFHVYVHSSPEFIEKGFDNEKNMKYYKLYFEDEN
ncbi:MAG: nucleoid-associated protein [Bacteroidota bacterium]